MTRLSRKEYPPKSKELDKQFSNMREQWRQKNPGGHLSIFLGESTPQDKIKIISKNTDAKKK